MGQKAESALEIFNFLHSWWYISVTESQFDNLARLYMALIERYFNGIFKLQPQKLPQLSLENYKNFCRNSMKPLHYSQFVYHVQRLQECYGWLKEHTVPRKFFFCHIVISDILLQKYQNYLNV